MMADKPSLVILISGNGSNLQAIIDVVCHQDIPAHIHAVISNNLQAYGLIRAQQAHINTHSLDHRGFASRDIYDQHLIALCNQYQPDFIVLAGFMRILSPLFINTFANKIINIHPSLLPKYPGLNTHERVLEQHDSQHGATVHFVTEELDAGPGILQGIISIRQNESKEQLIERVHQVEHIIYPKAIKWLVEKRINYHNKIVTFDGEPLPSSGYPMSFENI